MPRATFNPKRKIRAVASDALANLANRVKYAGSPFHKRNPGDFGLSPPSQPRPDKTLCDATGITTVRESLRLLRLGVSKGLISEQTRGGFPQNIWSVTDDGIPLEAQLTNRETGVYHGYPMPSSDDFRDQVLRHWRSDS